MGRRSRQERTEQIVNSNAVPEIIFDIVLIALGVVLIVWPVSAALMMTRIVGIVILALAIIEVVVFALSKSKEAMEYVLLVFSVLMAALGIWLIVNPDWLVQFFNILFGVILGIYGLFGVFSSVGYGRKSGGLWWIGLILSIIAIAMSALIFMNPFATPKMLMIIIGVSLVLGGITGIFNRIRLRKVRKVLVIQKTAIVDAPDAPPDLGKLKDAGSDGEER